VGKCSGCPCISIVKPWAPLVRPVEIATSAFDAFITGSLGSARHYSALDAMTPRILPRLSSPVSEAKDRHLSLRAKSVEVRGGSSLLDRLKLHFISDEELVMRLQTGEADALTVLFERHSALVYRVAQRILRDSTESEDTVQQIFLDFYRSAEKFDVRKGTFKSWLLMFSYHRTLNRKRLLQSRGYYDSDSFEESSASITHAYEQLAPFNTAETACLVEEALNLVKPAQRRVIELMRTILKN
jgi:RNA polymerase sigma factor (sigma-70 family)